MWWITGGYHYAFSEKYKICSNSYQILNERKGLSYKGFKRKKKLYEKFNNLYFVSPSKWLLNCAKESELTRSKPLFYIPNVIGNSIFKPLDKSFTRKILGLPEDKTIICFGAESPKSPHKGWVYLLEALQILKDSGLTNLSVLIFGKGSKSEIESEVPYESYFVGFLNDEYSLSLVYNAADVFVISSLADNQPTVVMESLSCGTPVVGFNVGGIPDMIRHEQNGYLANYKDSQDLAKGVQFCLQSKIKGKILPTFEKTKVTNLHLELIEMILKKPENN
jgi:glycosyltransferase involved in cell wall biosynthesis